MEGRTAMITRSLILEDPQPNQNYRLCAYFGEGVQIMFDYQFKTVEVRTLGGSDEPIDWEIIDGAVVIRTPVWRIIPESILIELKIGL